MAAKEIAAGLRAARRAGDFYRVRSSDRPEFRIAPAELRLSLGEGGVALKLRPLGSETIHVYNVASEPRLWRARRQVDKDARAGSSLFRLRL